MKKKNDSTPDAMLMRVIRVAEILAKTDENSLKNQYPTNTDVSNVWLDMDNVPVQKPQR